MMVKSDLMMVKSDLMMVFSTGTTLNNEFVYSSLNLGKATN